MKKKIGIGIVIFLVILIIAGIITNYVDSGRVETGHEPKYCIKIVSNDGSKVTYWGLGYKVIRYVGVSPNEPYESNIGVKMGNWFMKYELSKTNAIEIEYEGKKTTITDINDIGTIENILVNSKYNTELCNGINTHKITLNNEIYYIKEDCKEIQKGDKQAKITDEDLETINNIISNKMNNEQNSYSKKIDETIIEFNIPNEWNYEEMAQDENNNYKFALKLYKDSSDKSIILYFYNNSFGVCGTGRTAKKIKLNNGKEATIGYYDNNKDWSDISFYELNPNITFINNGIKDDDAEKFLNIVKTINIKKNTDYENIFNAKIKEINEYNGITTILIKGLESNDINYRGEFEFSVDNDTKLLWIKPNSIKSSYTAIDLSKLKEGQNVSITSIGEVLERYPAKLTKVTKVVVLEEQL